LEAICTTFKGKGMKKKLYKILEMDNNLNQLASIELLEDAGKYAGIVYRYGQIKFANKENDDGTYTLSFDWDILKYNDIPENELNKEELADIICVIIEELLELALNKKEGFHVGTNNDREDDTISVNLQ
jgi:hypothetical protein